MEGNIEKMEATWDVQASRQPGGESVFISIEARRGGHANLFLTRGEARAIAAALVREADWLDRADHCVPIAKVS